MTEQVDEQKYGLEGIEQSQGYSPMPMANPDPEPVLSDEQVAHFNRPAPPPPVERAYHDMQSGEHRPDNEVVEMDRAAEDLANLRRQEKLELESQRNADLNQALDFLAQEEAALKDAATPRPVEPVAEQQPAEPQPDAFQPQPEALPEGADPDIAAALANPKVRGIFEATAAQMQNMEANYQQAQQQLAVEAVATLAAIAPELAGMNPQQAAGALQLIAQSNPARAQQIAQTINRAQTLIQAQQQREAQLAQAQRQQYQEGLAAYEAQEVKRYETLIAKDRSPEQIKALRENVFPMVERHYGIPQASMRDLYSGAAPVSGAEFMRSSAFQLMLSDAIAYRMSRESVGRAAHHPVPHVVRPGSPEAFQTRTEAALAEAQSKLKPSMSAKEAASYLIARRAAR